MRRRRQRKNRQQASEIYEEDKKPVNPEEETIARYKKRIRNPLTAIRAHCVECFGGAVRDVTDCPSTDCALWPFRMGKNTMHSRYKRKGEEDEDSIG